MKKNLNYRFKRIKKTALTFLLVGAFSLSLPFSAYASSTNQLKTEVDDAKKELEAHQQQQNALKDVQKQQQNEADKLNKENQNLTNKSDKLKKDINSLNNSLTEVVADITEAEGAVADKEIEIEGKEAEIQETLTAIDDKKVSMSRRIQYSYENSSNNIIVLLAESKTFIELLNRLEYASSVAKYDNKMLDEFTALSVLLAEEKAALEASKAELEAFQESLNAKRAELGALVNSNTAALLDANGKL
ncbi:MAG: hypothetical protein HUJ70_12410, partial [Pseudobutyrivibrio sp.]|nr:hypothetical protein [Pseudobutyrivibrio sp.]